MLIVHLDGFFFTRVKFFDNESLRSGSHSNKENIPSSYNICLSIVINSKSKIEQNVRYITFNDKSDKKNPVYVNYKMYARLSLLYMYY